MHNLTWSPKEKRVAREVFERAALAEEHELLANCKMKAASLKNIEDLNSLQYWIQEAERAYQEKYDYRYSQLIIVFGRLLREQRISIEELGELDKEKLAYIKHIGSF